MADKKINELTAIDALAAGDLFPADDVSDSNATKKVTGTQIITLVTASLDTITSYTAAVSASTGATIAQATHGLATDRGLSVTFYDGDGDEVKLVTTVSGAGAVTWASNDALTGTIVIQG